MSLQAVPDPPHPDDVRQWYRPVLRTGASDPVFASWREIQKIKRVGRHKVYAYERARLHTCTVCQVAGPWSSAWGWYGSWKQIDDGNPIVKICSESCFVEAKKRRLIPKSAKVQP
jgi:hypothetical protein